MSNSNKKHLRFLPQFDYNPYSFGESNKIDETIQNQTIDKSYNLKNGNTSLNINNNNQRQTLNEKRNTESRQKKSGQRLGRIKYESFSFWNSLGFGLTLSIFPPFSIIFLISLIVTAKDRFHDYESFSFWNSLGFGLTLSIFPPFSIIFLISLIVTAKDRFHDYESFSFWNSLGFGLTLSIFPPFSIIFLISLIVTAKDRFHDLDKSGLNTLLLLIPLFGLLVHFYLLLAGGTKGNNDYGKPPESAGVLAYFGYISHLLLYPISLVLLAMTELLSTY